MKLSPVLKELFTTPKAIPWFSVSGIDDYLIWDWLRTAGALMEKILDFRQAREEDEEPMGVTTADALLETCCALMEAHVA